MSVTTEQFNEMKARTEKARKKLTTPITDTIINRMKDQLCDHKFVDSNRCIKCGWIPLVSGFATSEADCRPKKETGSVRLVLDFWASEGVPRPLTELRFCPGRKWRFDFCWFLESKVALECQGGVFTQGRHTRGAALLKEWEKLNEAAILGWRIIFCQPSDLLTVKLAQTIKRALKI